MRALVVGLGNEERGDDAVGPAAARRLRRLVGGGATVIEHPGEPIDLIAEWDGLDLVVLIDAARGRPTGTIQRYEHGVVPLPPGALGASSHAFDLAVAIEVAASLGRLPRRLVIYAVGGERFGFGDPMSAAVRRAIDDVAERVQAEVHGAPARRCVPDAREAGT